MQPFAVKENIYTSPRSFAFEITPSTEYVDFQCEACYAYYPVVKEVKEKYKDRVKFQVKNFPISSSHPNARKAAAKQDKFFEVHDLIFERQKLWQNDRSAAAVFESYTREIGLDMEVYKKDVASSETGVIINADLNEVKKLGGNGTPTFVLNGKK